MVAAECGLCGVGVHLVFEGLGKMGYVFQGLESVKTVGSVKVCDFCGLQSAREKLSAYQSETAFPKTGQ